MDIFLKKGLFFSAVLHGLFFITLLIILILNSCTRRSPVGHVFQLESVQRVDIPAAKTPISVAKVEPVVTQAPTSNTAVAFPPKNQKVESTPKVSYQDFLKTHKPPIAKTLAKSKEVKTPVASSTSLPKIDASDIKKNLEKKLLNTKKDISTTAIEGGAGPYDYRAYLRSAIDASWDQPENFSGYNNDAIFEFDVDKFGRICNVKVIRSSGSNVFDESVRNAFVKTSFVKPTPDGLPLVGCRLTFSKRTKKLP